VPRWDPNKEIISWDAVEGAKSYVLRIDGRDVPVLEGTSYHVVDLSDGKHSVTVRAIGDSEHSDSAESEAKTFSFRWSGWFT